MIMLRRFAQILILVTVNLALLAGGLVALEVYLWYTWPGRGLPANGTVNGVPVTWGHVVSNNRFGFRERDFAVPKPAGTYRIMILGDSLTWGAGLAVDERYTNLLESSLHKAFPSRSIEVLNFGISGGPTVVERNILRQFGEVVAPDLIVVGFCFNDPQPGPQDYSAEKARFDDHYGPHIEQLRRAMASVGLRHTGDAVKKAAYLLAERLGMIPPWQSALDRTYAGESPEWQAFVEALRDIRAMSDAMRLPRPVFAVLNQGTYTDRPTDYANPDPQLRQYLHWYQQAIAAAAESGFLVVSYEREIAEELRNEALAVNTLDGHPSARLNTLYARKLSQAIAPLIAAADR
jgi:lysophospholipase L1-like esterase